MIENYDKFDFIPCDNNIITCYKCDNIPIIGLHYTSYGLFIDYYCKNNHKGKIDIEKFLNNFQFSKKDNYSLCEIHKIKITKFCYHCIQNICDESIDGNDNHFLEAISEQKLTQEEKKKIIISIKKAEDYLNEIKKIKTNIKEFDIFIKRNEFELILIKRIYSMYLKHENNLIIEMITNVRNILNFNQTLI